MQLLQIMNLAGVLLFAEQPEWIVPQFVVIAIRYRLGNRSNRWFIRSSGPNK